MTGPLRARSNASVRWGSMLVLALALTACADGSPRPQPRRDAAAPAAPTPDPGATGTTGRPEPGRIDIRAGDVRLVATLRDTVAARDLVSQLPARVRMSDHGGVEKTGPLLRPLAVDDEPAGADPEVGDLGYYAPADDLVLYHGDQAYFDGIVVLGRLEGDLTSLADLTGEIDVHLRRADDDS